MICLSFRVHKGGVSSPNQKLLCVPAALSKMRVWTLSLGRIGPNYKAYRQFVAPIRLLTRRPWYMASLQVYGCHQLAINTFTCNYWPLAPVVLESVQSLFCKGDCTHMYKFGFAPFPPSPPPSSPSLPPPSLPPSPLPLLFRLHNGELCEAQSSWHHP